MSRVVIQRPVKRANRCRIKAQAVQDRQYHLTKHRKKLDVISKQPLKSKSDVPEHIVFLHGSYHANWCWSQHYFDYFSERGYQVSALSFLGQGLSDEPDGSVSGTLESHAEDVEGYLDTIQGKKVVVGHSFGGLILQKVVERGQQLVDGAALLHSVPPSGNSAMVGRFLRRTPIAALKLSYAFISRNFEDDLEVCKDLFFSSDIDAQALKDFQALIKGSCKAPLLDLRNLSSELPIAVNGNSSLIGNTLVLGSSADKVVDVEAVEETALAFGVEPIILDNVAHDCMLDTRWEVVAKIMLEYISGI